MAHISVRQAVPIHIASEVLWVIFGLDASGQVARVELARDCDTTLELEGVLLWVARVYSNLIQTGSDRSCRLKLLFNYRN